eukprot:COSAG06_NODE_632_length_13608_cov_26.746613_13_plen_210_part_00
MCDLVDDAADADSDGDEVYAHDLATCCESSTSTPTPTPTPSDSVDIGGADYYIDWRVGGVPYPDMTASVGETIAFSYSSQHNVFLLTSGNCEPSGSTELGGTLDSPVLFELTRGSEGASARLLRSVRRSAPPRCRATLSWGRISGRGWMLCQSVRSSSPAATSRTATATPAARRCLTAVPTSVTSIRNTATRGRWRRRSTAISRSGSRP